MEGAAAQRGGRASSVRGGRHRGSQGKAAGRPTIGEELGARVVAKLRETQQPPVLLFGLGQEGARAGRTTARPARCPGTLSSYRSPDHREQAHGASSMPHPPGVQMKQLQRKVGAGAEAASQLVPARFRRPVLGGLIAAVDTGRGSLSATVIRWSLLIVSPLLPHSSGRPFTSQTREVAPGHVHSVAIEKRR